MEPRFHYGINEGKKFNTAFANFATCFASVLLIYYQAAYGVLYFGLLWLSVYVCLSVLLGL